MKCVILVKWSTTTKIELEVLESERFTMKFMVIDDYGFATIGYGYNNSYEQC